VYPRNRIFWSPGASKSSPTGEMSPTCMATMREHAAAASAQRIFSQSLSDSSQAANGSKTSSLA